MDVEIDHYTVLGLPSGEEGARLSEKEIAKAYRLKALVLHPDKRQDDPNAQANFQKLQNSYEVLKDENARKLFDELLRIRREKLQRQSQANSKRRKMMSDLEERERAAFAPDPSTNAREEEERIARKLKEEIARIRALHASKGAVAPSTVRKETMEDKKEGVDGGGRELDKEKVLRVSWKKFGEDYTAQRLRELFDKFGKVEDVVIKNSGKKRSALVVMASKDAAVAAAGNVWEGLSNPLQVIPLQSAVYTPSTAQRTVETHGPELSCLFGAGHQTFEDSVLKKLQKAAEQQK